MSMHKTRKTYLALALVIATTVGLFSASDLSARRRYFDKNEIHLFMGFMPYGYTSDLNLGESLITDDLYSIYEPHTRTVNVTPLFTFQYQYLPEEWLRLGASVNYWTASGENFFKTGPNRTEVIGDDLLQRSEITIMPTIHFSWINTPHFKMYAGIGAGMALRWGELGLREDDMGVAIDVTPLGMQWGGERVYGTGELSFGNVMNGVRLGFGVRF